MKKYIKTLVGILLLSVSTFTFSSCEILLTIASVILAGGGGSDYTLDEDYVVYDDKNQRITNTGLTKIQGNVLDLSYLPDSAKDKTVYTYQINTSEKTMVKEKCGFIFNYKGNSTEKDDDDDDWLSSGGTGVVCSTAENTVLPRSASIENGATNPVPDFVSDHYRNPGKYLNASSNNRAAETDQTFTTRRLGIYENFNVTKSSGSSITEKTGTKVYSGSHCVVYLARDENFKGVKKLKYDENGNAYETNENFCSTYNNKIDQKEIENLGKKFDSYFTNVTSIMGSVDLSYTRFNNVLKDDYDKIVIFINDIDDDKLSPSAGVVGYFYSNDLINTETSNKCRMFYLDSYFLQSDINNSTKICESTLVHEFTHMCNYINKALINGNQGSFSWFTEMLAMTCEDILSNIITGPYSPDKQNIFTDRLPRVNAFYTNGFTNWDSKSDVLSNYSMTYAFGGYLLRNFAEEGQRIKLIHEIATNRYVNEDAISRAFQELRIRKNDGSNNYANFDYALALFPQALINAGSSSRIPTFSISGYETWDGVEYKIQGVDLKDFSVRYNDNGETVSGPAFMRNKNQNSYDYVRNLGSKGFDLHKYGKVSAMQTIYLEREKSRDIDFYIFIQ